MEIVTSKVSVYEVELDLRSWDSIDSTQVPGFCRALSDTIISLKEHKCMSGQAGGFLNELHKGTNFAHVIEHVLLELIHLADPDKQVYTGWTREKEDRTYVIHYSAPDFLTGRLAAILGVDLVKRLIQGDRVDVNHYIELLKEPSRYFTREDSQETSLVEPASAIPEIEQASQAAGLSMTSDASLSADQESTISEILADTGRHLSYVSELWRASFLEYAGNFGRAIIDKIELLNIDNFKSLLIQGDFQRFFRGIRNISHVVASYHIPVHFVIHSIWLYKNSLLGFVIEEHKEDREMLHRAVLSFENFFQVVLKNVSSGYSSEEPERSIKQLTELRQFRELKASRGLILAVDDDEITRRAFRDLLEYHGYRTILAEDGNQALEILSDKGDEIQLVILDLFMPGMAGRDVYTKMKELFPDLRILISSGYPIDSETDDLFSRESVAFISKPFKVEEFLDRVQSLLDSRPAAHTA
ncbi:MAG: response regulator [bacterium]|nr:response regulator [bacterium]